MNALPTQPNYQRNEAHQPPTAAQSHTTGSEELQKPSGLLPVGRMQSSLHMALLSLIAAYAVSQGSHLRCRQWSN